MDRKVEGDCIHIGVQRETGRRERQTDSQRETDRDNGKTHPVIPNSLSGVSWPLVWILRQRHYLGDQSYDRR